MKIIFMGTPDYAQAILQTLINTSIMEVVAVYTQPDKPVGRKKTLTPPAVKVLAQQNTIKVYQPSKLRDKDVVEELQAITCDYIVVAAYGQILPVEILEHAPCINLHASILPQYRGASPIQQTLLNDDARTGVTAMRMDVGMDTGDILKIQTIDVDKDELVSSLFDRLTEVACELTIDVLENFENLLQVPQDNSSATHCSKITKDNGEVDFDDAYRLYNKYRAYTPWPGIYLKNGLKLKKIDLVEKCSQNENAKILSIDKDSILLACTKGTIRVYTVQAPSKKEVDVLSYINGKRLKLEDYFS